MSVPEYNPDTEEMNAAYGRGYAPLSLLYPRSSKNCTIFCMPKSGSTYSSFVIGLCLGYKETPLYTRSDIVLSRFDTHKYLQALSIPNSIIRSHDVANLRLKSIMRVTGIKPIIIVRDLYTCLESLSEYWSETPDHRIGQEYGFRSLSPSEKLTNTVLRFGSELIDFIASWSSTGLKMYRYEDMTNDPKNYFKEIFSDHGLSVSDDKLTRALHLSDTIKSKNPRLIRYNQKSQRPKITDFHIDLLSRIMKEYPRVNFDKFTHSRR